MGFSWLWSFVVAAVACMGFIGLSWPVVACCVACCGCYDPEAVRLAVAASGVPGVPGVAVIL